MFKPTGEGEGNVELENYLLNDCYSAHGDNLSLKTNAYIG